MAETDTVRARLIVIGNEILSGRTRDANIQYIAQGLGEIGVRLEEVRVVPDVPDVIVATVNECRAACDYVFTTGGIGPTHDDITSECVAAAFGLPLHRHPEAVALLESWLPPGGLNEARLRMATVPEGAELIKNPISAAPGFRIGNVFVMAGVPDVMQAMFDGIRHDLKGGAKMLSRSIRVSLGEGLIADTLRQFQDRYPVIEIGSYPAMRRGGFSVSVVLRSTDAAALDTVKDELIAALGELGGDPVEEKAGG